MDHDKGRETEAWPGGAAVSHATRISGMGNLRWPGSGKGAARSLIGKLRLSLGLRGQSWTTDGDAPKLFQSRIHSHSHR